jgi:hypothetical protein
MNEVMININRTVAIQKKSFAHGGEIKIGITLEDIYWINYNNWWNG